MSSGGKNVEIVCSACGAETFLKREPQYEGFTKVGEKLMCCSCGHVFPSEQDVPYQTARQAAALFDESDMPKRPTLFDDEPEIRNCRRCAHYVVHRFAQRCGLTQNEAQATDCCSNFTPAKSDDAGKAE